MLFSCSRFVDSIEVSISKATMTVHCASYSSVAHTHTHMHAYYNCRNQWTIDFILFVLVIFLSFRAVLSFEILSLFLISRFMLVFVRVRCSSWMFVPFNTDPSSDTICNSMDDEFEFKSLFLFLFSSISYTVFFYWEFFVTPCVGLHNAF